MKTMSVGREGVDDMRRSIRRWGRGFSMIEMTLVIALIGILMTVAVFAFLPQLLAGKVTATKATMKTVDAALGPYKAANNAFPATLAMLAPSYLKNPPKDAWKRDFYYTVPGANGRPYDLISAGDDGQLGTPDDIDWAVVEKE